MYTIHVQITPPDIFSYVIIFISLLRYTRPTIYFISNGLKCARRASSVGVCQFEQAEENPFCLGPMILSLSWFSRSLPSISNELKKLHRKTKVGNTGEKRREKPRLQRVTSSRHLAVCQTTVGLDPTTTRLLLPCITQSRFVLTGQGQIHVGTNPNHLVWATFNLEVAPG